MAGYRQPLSRGEILGAALAVLVIAAAAALFVALLSGGPATLLGDLLAEPYLRRVLAFTLVQAGLSALLSVGLAVPVARALARQSAFPGRRALLRVCALPLVMPAIVAIFGIVAVYGRFGYLADTMGALGSGWRPSIYGLPGILLAHAFFNLPFAIRLLLPAWATVPPEAWRLSAQLGMSSGQIFRLIEAPLLRQNLPAVFALVFMLCFLSFAVVLTLGGGPRATTLEVAIYQAVRFDFDLPRAGAIALLQIACCLALATGAWLCARRLDLGRSQRIESRRFDGQSGAARVLDFAAILLATVFILAPLLALAGDGMRGIFAAGSIHWPNILRASLITVALGLAAGLLAVGLGYPMAMGADRLRRRARGAGPAALVRAAGFAGLVISPMALGAGIQLAARGRLDLFALAPVGVVVMNGFLALPFVLGALAPAVARANDQHDRLCLGLGIRGWHRFFTVDGPALRRPIAGALALAATISMGDLAAISLFGNQDLTNLTLVLYGQLAAYRLDQASVTAVILLALCLAVFAAIERGVGGRGVA